MQLLSEMDESVMTYEYPSGLRSVLRVASNLAGNTSVL